MTEPTFGDKKSGQLPLRQAKGPAWVTASTTQAPNQLHGPFLCRLCGAMADDEGSPIRVSLGNIWVNDFGLAAFPRCGNGRTFTGWQRCRDRAEAAGKKWPLIDATSEATYV